MGEEIRLCEIHGSRIRVRGVCEKGESQLTKMRDPKLMLVCRSSLLVEVLILYGTIVATAIGSRRRQSWPMPEGVSLTSSILRGPG